MSYLMSTELCMVEMLTLINIKPKKTAIKPSPIGKKPNQLRKGCCTIFQVQQP